MLVLRDETRTCLELLEERLALSSKITVEARVVAVFSVSSPVVSVSSSVVSVSDVVEAEPPSLPPPQPINMNTDSRRTEYEKKNEKVPFLTLLYLNKNVPILSSFKGWIHIKTVILRNALLSKFSKNIKQLTYAGCQSEIPLDSSRFRMNRKFCYQSAT